jgi:hypothetical protein
VLGLAPNPTGTTGAPVNLASRTAPGCATWRGPRGPSGTTRISAPSSRISRASVSKALAPPREDDPRTTRAPNPWTKRLRISPSRDRLVRTWIRGRRP